MIRLIWRTDVHMSDVGPSSRTDDWAGTVLDKLDQVGRLAEKLEASAVLDGGDFFHIKSPSRNSHEMIRRVAEVHTSYPCPVYANIGNHDCVYGDYSFIGRQPLGVLFASGVFRRCYDEHEAVFEQGGVKVRVVGVPYHGTRYDMERFRSIRKKDEDFLVVTAHVLASRSGGSMFEGEDIIKYKDLLDTDADCYAFGHWHKDQGIDEIGGKAFINVGSLTRGALTQDEVQRRPAVVVLEFTPEGMKTRIVRLKVKPPEEVFDLERRVQVERRALTIEKFVSSIRDTIEGQKGTSLEEVVQSMPLTDEVRERLLLYLEKAS